MNEDTVAMTIRFPRDVHEQLRQVAHEQRRTRTDLVVEATRQMLSAHADMREEHDVHLR